MTEKPLIELENVTVSYSGFKALDNLNFSFMTGGVKVLIGPNGSGKSTILDTIIGKVQPTAGRVLYKGIDITNFPEHRIAQMGIQRKFQTPGVLGNLSVYDNLAVAVRRSKGFFANLRPDLNSNEKSRVDEVLTLIGLREKQKMRAFSLSHGEKQWLDIGMVVSSEPEVLLLDEPTGGMTTRESELTVELIRTLANQHTVLVIDHDMTFVEQLDASISVLYSGRLLCQGNMKEIRENPDVVAVYLGRPEVQPMRVAVND